MSIVLETKDVKKHFEGVHAVDGISIGFEKGKIIGLIGPNGSGKTTLMNTLSGMFPMTAGAVVISDVELEKIKRHEVAGYGISRTFQNVRLFEQMSVWDNVLVVLTKRAVLPSIREKHGELHIKKTKEVLKRMGIWEKRDELAGNLSYGQRKLLEMARVIAMDADIVLLDEPYAGLFPEMVKIVSEVVRELKKEGRTIILIEHNMQLIRELCDHVFVMDEGKLLAEGNPESVLERRDVIEAYLGD